MLLHDNCFILLLIGVFVADIVEAAPKRQYEKRNYPAGTSRGKQIDETSYDEWPKFEALDKDGVKTTEYRIEYLPYSQYRQAVNLMLQYMFTENPFVIAFGKYFSLNISNFYLFVK